MKFLEDHGVYFLHLDTLGIVEADKFRRYLLGFSSVEDYDLKHKRTFVLFLSPNGMLL